MISEMTIPQIAEKIYRDHYPELLERAAKMMAGNIELAKDAVMDVFRGFIENEWQIEEKNRLNYFLKAVTRRSIDILVSLRGKHRTDKNYFSNYVEEIIEPFENDTPFWMDPAAFDKIKSLLFNSSFFKKKTKKVLQLALYGMPPREIAQHLNTTSKSVSLLKDKAIRRLRTHLNNKQ